MLKIKMNFPSLPELSGLDLLEEEA